MVVCLKTRTAALGRWNSTTCSAWFRDDFHPATYNIIDSKMPSATNCSTHPRLMNSWWSAFRVEAASSWAGNTQGAPPCRDARRQQIWRRRWYAHLMPSRA